MKDAFSSSLREVLSHDIGEVLTSPSLLSKLLYLYSYLFLDGKPPALCGKCHKKYYYKLKNNGMEKALLADKVKNRTCVPAWNGLKFIVKKARHYNDKLISDEQAISLLNEGFLKEDDFKKLPDGYKENPSASTPKEKKKKSPKKKPENNPPVIEPDEDE